MTEIKKKRVAKLTDVAKLAGVSTAAVSVILNEPNNNRFSEDTVKRVLEAASELQYQPATYARQMKGKNLSVIGLIIPDLMNHYYPEVTCGFTNQANRMGYNVILLNSNNDIVQEQFFTETLIGMKVAGVALCGVYSTDEREVDLVKRLNSVGIPVIRFDRYDFSEICPYVGIDNYLAGYCITEKLIQAGHKSIACFSPKEPVFIVAERFRGYQIAMENYGLQSLSYKIDNGEFGSLYQNVEAMWNSDKRATAIFTPGGDMDAIECIKSASTLKIDVPGELSIAGFDDIYLANIINPALTTIRQPKFEMGEAAMKLLGKIIKNEEIEKSGILLPFEYIARESTRTIR